MNRLSAFLFVSVACVSHLAAFGGYRGPLEAYTEGDAGRTQAVLDEIASVLQERGTDPSLVVVSDAGTVYVSKAGLQAALGRLVGEAGHPHLHKDSQAMQAWLENGDRGVQDYANQLAAFGGYRGPLEAYTEGDAGRTQAVLDELASVLQASGSDPSQVFASAADMQAALGRLVGEAGHPHLHKDLQAMQAWLENGDRDVHDYANQLAAAGAEPSPRLTQTVDWRAIDEVVQDGTFHTAQEQWDFLSPTEQKECRDTYGRLTQEHGDWTPLLMEDGVYARHDCEKALAVLKTLLKDGSDARKIAQKSYNVDAKLFQHPWVDIDIELQRRLLEPVMQAVLQDLEHYKARMMEAERDLLSAYVVLPADRLPANLSDAARQAVHRGRLLAQAVSAFNIQFFPLADHATSLLGEKVKPEGVEELQWLHTLHDRLMKKETADLNDFAESRTPDTLRPDGTKQATYLGDATWRRDVMAGVKVFMPETHLGTKVQDLQELGAEGNPLGDPQALLTEEAAAEADFDRQLKKDERKRDIGNILHPPGESLDDLVVPD